MDVRNTDELGERDMVREIQRELGRYTRPTPKRTDGWLVCLMQGNVGCTCGAVRG